MKLRTFLHVITVLSLATACVVAVATAPVSGTGAAASNVVRVQTPGTLRSPPIETTPASTTTTLATTPGTTTAVAPLSSAALPSPAPSAAPPPLPAVATVDSIAALPPMPSLVARVTDSTLDVFRSPADRDAWQELPGVTAFGNPSVLPVTALGGDWLEVLLPTRPNSSQGWIRKGQVTLSPVNDQVVVDLGARQLTWVHAGVVVLQTTAAIGSVRSPTPVGQFFVTDVLPRSPGGPYGAWIVALDGHSDTFTEFDGGDARIAIHGTDAPSTIGEPVSSGCVRVAADALSALAAALPLGTPVLIR